MADYFSTTALPDILTHNLEESPTSIELLRLGRASVDAPSILEFDGILGDEILDHILVSGSQCGRDLSPAQQPYFQLLFLSSIRDSFGCTTKRVRVTRDTLEKITIQLGIATSFLEAILIPSIWSKQSCGSFHRYDAAGEIRALDGFYHYFENWDLGPLHLWFNYDIISQSTTYLLVDCPEAVKERIKSKARSHEREFLFRPFAVDFLVAEECASWREKFINNRWEKLFDWHERSGNRMDPRIRTDLLNPENIQTLHTLSRTWNMLFEDLGDLDERLEFLIEISRKTGIAGIRESTSAAEAFQFLRARNRVRRRWVTSFGERTKLITNFVFNLEAQKVNQASLDSAEENKRNSKTNVEIQRLTATIADETAKDNSSMITIATMTMVFLPGTFTSAIFSMTFFTFSDSNSSHSVSHWLWLYFAVTIPLTAMVFGFYLYWRRRRESKRGQTSSVDLELASRIPFTNGVAV